jgi:hypothetical protein
MAFQYTTFYPANRLLPVSETIQPCHDVFFFFLSDQRFYSGIAAQYGLCEFGEPLLDFSSAR